MKKNQVLGSLFLLSVLASCASNSRNPSSESSEDLSVIIDDIKSASELKNINSSSCKSSYDQLYQRLFNLAGETTYLDLNDIKSMDEDIQKSFTARLALKDSFKSFNVDSDCLKSASDVFRGLRYVEDYLIELRMERSQSAPEDYVNLKGEFPYLLVNPKYANNFKSYEDSKSGDIILSRGNAFSSAAIARIGVNDYQFSHLSFVYQENPGSELMTTEAHIEIGSVVEPLLDHVSSKNSREVVFRYNGDEGVSHKASKFMFEKVKAVQVTGKHIPYDFSMDYKDQSKLFCSEIISRGFKHVLPSEDYFPKFKSKFTPGIIPFLNSIGVPVNKENINTLDVFSPGDIQFDPRFDLVAEWRNPRKMEESRMKDFILTKLFERMDNLGYQIDPSIKMNAGARALWLLRRTPVVKKFLKNKVSLEMNTDIFELFMALDKIGESIYKEVEKSSLEYERPMTPKEILSVIDDFFNRDLELYKRYKKGLDVMKPAFHLLFHP